MTRSVDIGAALRSWMEADASGAAPDDLLATVLTRTAATRQRPGWMPGLELPASPILAPRLVLLALVVLLVAAMAGALIVGRTPTVPTSVENGLIAVVGFDAASALDIYLVDPDGGAVTRVTDTPDPESRLTWSPDGTRLAFVRELDQGDAVPSGVDCEADPAACERGAQSESAIVVSAPTGGTERVVYQSVGVIHSLGWSPDGRSLSFVNERAGGLFILDVASRSAQLVFEGSVEGADWAPDGTRLATNTWTDASDADIYLAFPDGREPIKLTSQPGFETSPIWSPDGRRIAFTVDPDGTGHGGRIEVITADGTGRSVLAEDAHSPAWARDGGHFAFVRTFDDLSGRSDELWVMGSDGTGQRKLADKGSRPRWSPDGALIYWLGDGVAWSIRPDGSELTMLLSGEMWLGAGWGFDWQAVRP
ncbi:MAG TPA: hypothetical protein VF365_10345 [Candidatus Limnocylindria bacterium]